MRIIKGPYFKTLEAYHPFSMELHDFPFNLNNNNRYNSIYDLSFVYKKYIKILYEE